MSTFHRPKAKFPADCRRLQPPQRRQRSLDSLLRLPYPQRFTQRIDAEVGCGGLGAKGG
jgi:hypothetical protein